MLFRGSERPETCSADRSASAPVYKVLNSKTFDKKRLVIVQDKSTIITKRWEMGFMIIFFVLNWTLFWESLLLSNSEMMEFYITYISFSFVHIFHDFVIHIQFFIYTVKIRNKIRKVISWFYSRIWWSQFKSFK